MRITDFGLAGVAGAVKDIRSGTPGYLAPEQASVSEVVNTGDVWEYGDHGNFRNHYKVRELGKDHGR